MKKFLIALVVATIAAAAVKAASQQRDTSAALAGSAGPGEGSPRRRIPAPGNKVADIVEEAIETSAGDVSGAPTDDSTTQGT